MVVTFFLVITFISLFQYTILMNWMFFAFLAPFLWATSNHIDKYLLNKYFKDGGAGALIVFSALIGIPLLPIIYFIHPAVFSINFISAICIVLNGAIFVLALIPYMYALADDEASFVAPLFQTIPFFTYILAYIFLHESLTTIQIFAALLIIFGAVGLSLDIDNQMRLKKKIFWLMILSSFMISINSFAFKFIALSESFWVTSFWEYVGFSLLAVVLLVFVKSYRKQFFEVLKINTTRVLAVNAFNEVINIVAKIVMNFATLLAPLALVWVVNSIQPFFVLLIGIIITFAFPYLGKESFLKKHMLQKLASITIMILGTVLLQGY
jgi:uncharacterized membrane protein